MQTFCHSGKKAFCTLMLSKACPGKAPLILGPMPSAVQIRGGPQEQMFPYA